jgi:histone H3/H4
MMTKDATFLISLATEEFITRLSRASQVIADRENRATVQQRDLGVFRDVRATRLTNSSVAFISDRCKED